MKHLLSLSVPDSHESGIRTRPPHLEGNAKPRALTHVMVIDDDPVTCQVVSTILRARGYQVSVRAEALGTMTSITREKPDVVLLDLDMPGLSSDALARLVTSKRWETQIILHSTEPVQQLHGRARDTGALGCIEKGDPLAFLPAFEALLGR